MAKSACADKLILETILQDKFFYFKAEEGGSGGYGDRRQRK